MIKFTENQIKSPLTSFQISVECVLVVIATYEKISNQKLFGQTYKVPKNFDKGCFRKIDLAFFKLKKSSKILLRFFL